jgi:hypothetical protein
MPEAVRLVTESNDVRTGIVTVRNVAESLGIKCSIGVYEDSAGVEIPRLRAYVFPYRFDLSEPAAVRVLDLLPTGRLTRRGVVAAMSMERYGVRDPRARREGRCSYPDSPKATFRHWHMDAEKEVVIG